MPFFQSVAVRFGVKSFLQECGVDDEAAGWLAAGASLLTAVATADMHGHLAGEAMAHGVSHASGHFAGEAASHGVSHASGHVASAGVHHGAAETASQVSSTHTQNAGSSLSSIADIQQGPTCGFESVENMAQCANLDVSNNFSNILQTTEFFDGGDVPLHDGGYALDSNHYQHILAGQGVATHWASFDHHTIATALHNNQGVLVLGDAHYLDPQAYPKVNSFHAFMLTDVVVDNQGYIVEYRGIDSNFGEKVWSPQQIAAASQHTQLSLSHGGEVLIADQPMQRLMTA